MLRRETIVARDDDSATHAARHMMTVRAAAVASSSTTAVVVASVASRRAPRRGCSRVAARASSKPSSSIIADDASSSSSSSSATRHHHASRRGVFMAGAGAPLLRLATMTTGTGAASLNLTARAAAASSYGSVEDTTSEIAKVLLDPKYPDVYPFDASMMARYDESKDSAFYSQPRFVQHIDDDAIKALTGFYARTFPASGSDDVALLDVCSSWCARAASDRVPYDRVRVVDVDRKGLFFPASVVTSLFARASLSTFDRRDARLTHRSPR